MLVNRLRHYSSSAEDEDENAPVPKKPKSRKAPNKKATLPLPPPPEAPKFPAIVSSTITSSKPLASREVSSLSSNDELQTILVSDIRN